MGLSSALVVVAVCLLVQWALVPSADTWVQPRAPKSADAAPVLGALAALTASEICTNKWLFYVIAPACDPIFLVSPIYLTPILIVFWGIIVTVIQLLIPATQPDEDLR